MMPSEISIVFELACRSTLRPSTGRPFRRESDSASSGPKYTLATSPIRTESRMMMSETCAASIAVASARTISCCSAERKLPAGTSNGACLKATATSPTDSPKLVRRIGSRATRRTRWRLPDSCTSATPSMAISIGTMSFSTTRVRRSSVRLSLRTARLTTACASSSALMTTTCSTRSGSLRLTRLMASRMSEAALSMSVPGRNSTWIRPLFSSEAERIRCMPDTRATAPSSMEMTSASMVSGEAPGKSTRTDTTGRSTSGSSRTSTASSADSPASTISRLTTSTSTGRRMLRLGRSSWDLSSVGRIGAGLSRSRRSARRHRRPLADSQGVARRT